MPPYDRIDLAILGRLQTDGRIANIDLAEAVSLSPSACLRRLRALEHDGVIAGYRAELDAPTLAAYERILLDQILVIPAIVDARSTFAIRTVKTRGPLPLSHLA